MDLKRFGFEEVRRKVQETSGKQATHDEEILHRLQMIMEACCTHVKDNAGYKTQTGVLISSTGSRIYHNGELMDEYIVKDQEKEGYKGKGLEAAKNALDRFVDEIDIPLIGWACILVSGASYATYVEAKGYNVLKLTETEMKEQIEALRKELGF